MESPLQPNLEEIARLCRRYQVRRLAVFGSILRGDFDPLRSDADFLVEFEPVPVAVRMKNYLALRESLASLLSRPVDLIEDGAIRNPYILQSVSEQQQVLYAA
ncbi:MAG: nucleotidyltransferase domain-containing protein [Terracidiphilus sp.]